MTLLAIAAIGMIAMYAAFNPTLARAIVRLYSAVWARTWLKIRMHWVAAEIAVIRWRIRRVERRMRK